MCIYCEVRVGVFVWIMSAVCKYYSIEGELSLFQWVPPFLLLVCMYGIFIVSEESLVYTSLWV